MAEAVNLPGKGLFKNVEISLTSRFDVRSANFHPIEPALACALSSGAILLFKSSNHSTSLSTWKIERQFRCRSSALSLKFNASGTILAGGCSDGSLIVWCYLTGSKRVLRINRRLNFPVTVWNPFDLNVLANYNSAMDCKVVVIFNAATDHFYSLKSNENVWCVDWISRNRLACSYDDGTVEIHEIQLDYKSTSNLVKKLVVSTHFTLKDQVFPFPKIRGMKSDVWSIAWNEQLQLLASSSHDGWVKLWSMDSQDPVHAKHFSSYCCDLVWSPTRLPSSNEDPLEGEKEPYLACGMEDGSISIWAPLGKKMRPSLLLNGHTEQLHQVSFSPNGRYLASTDYDRKLIIWSTKTWDIIYTLPPSGCQFPYTISWDATSSKLCITEKTGLKRFLTIEYVAAENQCANCKKTSPNLKHCSRCRSVYYCSKECQSSQWSNHKTVCHKKGSSCATIQTSRPTNPPFCLM